MATRTHSAPQARRGFVLGELFVAILLLALAISSVSALMYSVTRPPRPRTAVECSEKERAASPACSPTAKTSSKSGASVSKTSTAEKLLVAGCATRTRDEIQACKDSVNVQGADGTTIRSRTDSTSLQLLPKKQKRIPRPDLGFVR
jgi:hypothetical protein